LDRGQFSERMQSIRIGCSQFGGCSPFGQDAVNSDRMQSIRIGCGLQPYCVDRILSEWTASNLNESTERKNCRITQKELSKKVMGPYRSTIEVWPDISRKVKKGPNSSIVFFTSPIVIALINWNFR
jgi:hypothetical protein